MDSRVVISFLCLLAAQASCRPTGDKEEQEAVIGTIQLIQEEIREALDHLSEAALLPNISCVSLNLTQLIKEEEQQPSTYQYLSTFCCFLMELSKQILKLSKPFQTICEYTQSVEQKFHTQTPQNCSLPPFENDLDSHVFAKCLLQVFKERNSKAIV